MAKAKHPFPSKKRIFCNTCRIETNHKLHTTHTKLDYHDEESGEWGEIVFVLWVCAGCDSATLQKTYTESDSIDKDGKQIYTTVGFFPKRAEHEVDGKRFKELPEKLDKIYRETLLAFNSDLVVLCAVGIRALIEGICNDRDIDGRTLERKINGMVSILPPNIVTNLHSLRFIGNDAAHELTAPKIDELRLALEICEDILNYLYELDYKARQLTNSRRSGSIPF